MKSGYDFVVLGDICLDWSSDYLSFPFNALHERQNRSEWTSIEESPGGSGLRFAYCAQEAGYSAFLIGKLGSDSAGRSILEWLEHRKIENGITVTQGAKTGRVFMTYDKEGTRLLIANHSNANGELSVSEIEQYKKIISNSEALFVSGHCFREPYSSRVEATLTAMEIAYQNNSCIIFDLVPHEFYKIYPDFSQFRQLTEHVSILISEVPTIRRILGLGNPKEEISRSIVEETASALKPLYSGFILRYGLYNLSTQLVWDTQKPAPVFQEFDVPKKGRSGFGEKVALQTLSDVFGFRSKSKLEKD